MPPPKVAIASNSLGKSQAGHGIYRKLEAAKAHGFDGMELAFECLDVHSHELAAQQHGQNRQDRLRTAALSIYNKASSLSLPLIALNPVGGFDGLADHAEVDERLQEADLWCQLCNIMHIPILQIPSCIYPMEKSRITPDPKKIAQNIRKLGRLAQKYDLVVAYEATAWGIHIDTWQQIHEIIALVNLPNVKHCLDTYHISARVAGDPFNSTNPLQPNGLSDLKSSLAELRETVLPTQIGYFQLSDATIADPEQRGYPVRDTEQPPFMTQSRNCRMYPCEPEEYGGVLPALDVAKTVFELRYRDWVSMEVFNADLWDPRTSVPDEWANRGIESWRKIVSECHLDEPFT